MSRRWLRRLGAALAVWVAAVVLSRLFGSTADVGLVGLAVAALAAVLWIAVDALGAGPVEGWDLDPDDPVRPPGQDLRLAALNRMVATHLESRRPGDGLPRALTRIADQRLMARYGVSWRVDPERARELLPPELVDLAEQVAPYPRMSIRHIDVLLTRIEAL